MIRVAASARARSAFAAATAVALLAAAGCADPSAKVGGTSPVPAATAAHLAVAASVPLPQTMFAREPRITSANGTLFVAAPSGYQSSFNGVAGADYLWRSPNGTTWQVQHAPAAPQAVQLWCSCDSDVVGAPDGWVYTSDWWFAGVGAGNFNVQASHDGGATWTSAPVTMPFASYIDRQWLAAGAGGLVLLTWSFTPPYRAGLNGTQPQSGFDREVWSAVSHDHGQTWGPPSQVTAYRAGSFPHAGHPLVLGDGTLLVPVGVVPGAVSGWNRTTSLRLYRSTDGGMSWSFAPVATLPQGITYTWGLQAATDGKARVAMAWTSRNGTEEPVFVSQSADGGRTWSAPEEVQRQGLNRYPWLDMDADGGLWLAWYGSNATDPKDPGAQWFPMVAWQDGPGSAWVSARADAQPSVTSQECDGNCPLTDELRDFLSVAALPGHQAAVAYMHAGADSGDGDANVRVTLVRAPPTAPPAAPSHPNP